MQKIINLITMKILFNHIPKTGGLYLNSLIQEVYDKKILITHEKTLIETEDYNYIYFHTWAPTYINLKKILIDNNLKYNFSFCFIRHPIDIFYSAFSWLKLLNTEYINYYHGSNEEMVNNEMQNKKFSNINCLIDFLESKKNTFIKDYIFPNDIFLFTEFDLFDYVFNYEDYNKALIFLSEKINLPVSNLKLDHKNLTNEIDKSYKLDFLNELFKQSIKKYEIIKKNKSYKFDD